MGVYLIGYDLHEGEDYSSLEAAITKLSTDQAWHCLDSTWMIIHPGPEKTVIDALTPHIKNATAKTGDKLLVVKLTRHATWTTSFDDGCKAWLRKHLPKA